MVWVTGEMGCRYEVEEIVLRCRCVCWDWDCAALYQGWLVDAVDWHDKATIVLIGNSEIGCVNTAVEVRCMTSRRNDVVCSHLFCRKFYVKY